MQFYKYPFSLMIGLGATSIEKIPKISASGRNFLDPLPPSSNKGPTESRTSPIFTIEVAP